jgi:chaperone required for assembly of F1-ATPase
MKRFWHSAGVIGEPGGYAIRLDGRPMRLPGGPHLVLRSLALAEAIAAEWQSAGGAKGGDFQAEDVPLTRIAGTAQERVAPDPASTIDALARYGETDLLCYRATGPDSLVAHQARNWQPWLAWASACHGADLRIVHGIIALKQPEGAVGALRHALARHTPDTLAGLGIIVPATGSLVLGLAVAEGVLDATEAHRLALLDELFLTEQWGEDREAVARRRAVAEDIAVAARFIALSREPLGEGCAPPA